MRLYKAALLVLTSWPLAFADVSIVYPSAGETLASGTLFAVSWQESASPPLLKDLTKYTINLYSGSNTAPVLLQALAEGTYTATVTTAQIAIPAAAGGATENAYFLGIESEAKTGGTVINYSSRFTASGMTGTFKPEVIAALKAVTGTDGPPTKNSVKGSSSSSTGSTSRAKITDDVATRINTAEGPYGTPYPLQTGAIRYAPMQPQPGTKITQTETKRMWPTSSARLASTFLPIPFATVTWTQARTHSVQSHPCSASPHPQPSDDWEKYLDRWKDEI